MAAFDACVQSWIRAVLFPYAAVLAACLVVPAFRKLAFAKYMDLFSPSYDAMVSPKKARFFSGLGSVVSADVELRNRGQFRLCELGVGTGVNFKYYPKNVRLVAVDPNVEFLSYFERNRRQHSVAGLPRGNGDDGDAASSAVTLEKFVLATTEALTPDQVPDGSVDVVVSTLVLCSVGDHAAFLARVGRLLAPGGRYYFWDHVAAPRGTRHWYLQKVVSGLFFWPYFGCGCRVDRRPQDAVRAAGFRWVDVEEFEVDQVPDDFLHRYVFSTLLKYHACGIAVK